MSSGSSSSIGSSGNTYRGSSGEQQQQQQRGARRRAPLTGRRVDYAQSSCGTPATREPPIHVRYLSRSLGRLSAMSEEEQP